MKHTTLWDTVNYPNDPSDDRVQGDEWNESHTLESDENFLTDAQLALLLTLGNTRYTTSFDDSDLAAGILTVTHNLNFKFVHVTVYNNNDVRISPDDVDVSGGVNSCTVDLSGYGTLTGTWNVVVSSTSKTSYTTSFDNGDLVAGVLSVTHSLSKQYVHVTVYNNSDVRIRPDEIDVSGGANSCDIDLSGFGTLTGTWNVVIS